MTLWVPCKTERTVVQSSVIQQLPSIFSSVQVSAHGSNKDWIDYTVLSKAISTLDLISGINEIQTSLYPGEFCWALKKKKTARHALLARTVLPFFKITAYQMHARNTNVNKSKKGTTQSTRTNMFFCLSRFLEGKK